jgi:uncharacterized protein (TIGR03067 family)
MMVLVFLFPATSLSVEDPIKAELDKARARYDAALDAAKTKLVAAMEAKRREFADWGALDWAAQIKAQKELFEKDGSLPKAPQLTRARTDYRSHVRAARDGLRTAIAAARDGYAKALKLEEAQALAAELKALVSVEVPIEAQLDEARDRYDVALDAAKTKLVAAMEAKRREFADWGALDWAAQIKAQKELFEKDGTLPKGFAPQLTQARFDYQSAARAARFDLGTAIKAAKDGYAKALKFDEARALAAELKALATAGTSVDLNEKFAEGSVWMGTVKERRGASDVTADIVVTVTKREGQSFEGTYEGGEGRFLYLIEGSIVREQVNFKLTKIQRPKGAMTSNLIGLEHRGSVRLDPESGKPTLVTNYTWRNANNTGLDERGVVIAALLGAGYAYGGPGVEALKELQGEWKVAEFEFPEYVTPDEDPKQWLLIVKGDQLEVNPSGKAGTGDPFTVKLGPAKKPKEFDITIPEESGSPLGGWTFPGIYTLEKDQLRLCISCSTRPAEFVRPKENGVLLVLKREKGR